MRNTSSLIPLLVAVVGALAGTTKTDTLTPAPFFASFCLFGADNYTVGETWHPFLSPNGYVCIKCSCVFVPSKGIATVNCYPLCKHRTCTESYGKCCSTCTATVGSYKYQACTDQQGQRHRHLSVWAVQPKHPSILNSSQCTECSCWDGFISCAIKNCARVSCRNPKRQRGTCCKTCSPVGIAPSPHAGCYSMGRFLTEGAVWYPQLRSYRPKCFECTCKKSLVRCQRLKCPRIKCANPIRTHPGDCCQTCPINRTTTAPTSHPVIIPPGTPLPYPNCTRWKGNSVYANGSQWNPVLGSYGKALCVICKCLNGKITCGRIKCPSVHDCQHCKGFPVRRSLWVKPCRPARYWKILKYVPSRPNPKFGTLKIKFALVKYPDIELYMLSGKNKTNRVWKVNNWKLKVGNRANALKVLNKNPFFRDGGRFKEIGLLRDGRQKDYLNKLVFRRCSSRCAAQVKEVKNYLRTTSRAGKARQCRSVPSVPMSLQMLTPDG